MAQTETGASAAEELAASVDSGGRAPTGWQRYLIPTIAFIWSIFQLYIASTLPFDLAEITNIQFFVVTDSTARLIHLSFAGFLAAMAFPLLKGSPRHTIPWYDWLLGLMIVAASLYIVFNFSAIADRSGLPTTEDLVFSSIGLVVLLIAVYRALGLPLVVITSIFMIYVFFGDARWLPDDLQWRGASYGKAMWHFWMQNEGVFGVALGVSATMIFLFVLFGAILEKAGAGNYFIKLAFALLGHLRGGPAKAAVVASAMSGLYSGSSIANTVTTGTFTIPLMKRTGLSAEKAGAVEVASSTNGQLTPPVMGAAAFLIAEFTGVPYTDILKHALLPALVSYIALVYIVHLEALKLGLKGMQKPPATMTVARKMIGVLTGFIGIAVLFMIIYQLDAWVKMVAPDMSFWTIAVIVLAAYGVLIWFASRRPDLEVDDPNAPIETLPRAGDVAITGLYYFLPIIVLIWCILPTPDKLSPRLAAFWACILMSFIALTQHPLKALLRGEAEWANSFGRSVNEWFDGMVAGARNMISIGVATGAAGMIIGTISLTGMHQVLGAFIETISGGNLMFMLILVAAMSLILGMGLPTTANYIVVSSLMAPIIVALGAKSGLLIPLVAAHLFVFYFGILADDTPPVGLAAFAAAAISGGDPIKTGVQGFMYDIRTALLPFLFIFNTELLLMDVTPLKAVFVFIVAVIAMMLFAAATQSYFFAKSRWWESAILLLIAFTLFRPGFWLDRVEPKYNERPGTEIVQIAESMAADTSLRITVSGPNFDNPDQTDVTTLTVPLGKAGSGDDRLSKMGLAVVVDGDKALFEEPLPGTKFEALSNTYDFYDDAKPVVVSAVKVENDRVVKEVFYIPALFLLGLVIMLQRRRQTQPAF
ncbi:MAG: TRAP transporter permease [Alphaproteobacteria bacterium]|nr:TRAP transporter permease [Alphaproteobacteria bacterium]